MHGRRALSLWFALAALPAFAQVGTGLAAGADEGAALSLEQAWLHETNPLRLPRGLSASSDAASVSTLDGAYRHRWGRQGFSANGRVGHTRYANESALDHETSRLGAALDLQTVGDWSARLDAQRQREPLEGQLRLDPVTGQRRMQTVERWGAALQWGLQRRWALDLQWQHDRLQPNRPQVWWPGYEQDTWRVQVRGDWRQTVYWGLGRRQQEGLQPTVPAQPSAQPGMDFRQGVWEAEWSWRPREGEAFTLRGAHGQGQRQWQSPGDGSPAAPVPASESAVSSLQAELRWRPAARWLVQGTWARDEGQQTQAAGALTGTSGLLLQGANEVSQVRLGVHWDLGPKWQVHWVGLRMDRRGQQLWAWGPNASWGAWTAQRWEDRLERHTLGAVWELSRRASAQCTIRREVKSGVNLDAPALSMDHRAVLWRDSGWQCGLRWVAVVLG